MCLNELPQSIVPRRLEVIALNLDSTAWERYLEAGRTCRDITRPAFHAERNFTLYPVNDLFLTSVTGDHFDLLVLVFAGS